MFLGALIVVLILLGFLLIRSDAKQAEKTVDLFYSLEQEAKFSSSWELLHSDMKQRFPVENYIQDRSHVFMNHFGVDTFTYSLSKPKKKESWQMTDDAEPVDVYQIIVTKNYEGKYGYFQFIQHTYVTKEDGEWRIMWDFKREEGVGELES